MVVWRVKGEAGSKKLGDGSASTLIDLAGGLVVYGLTTVFHSISGRLPERENKDKKDRREKNIEKNCPNNPNLHLLLVQ